MKNEMVKFITGRGRPKIERPAGERLSLTAAALLVVSIVLLWFPPASAQTEEPSAPAALEASLDRQSASIGDIVRLDLEYRLPPGAGPAEDLKIEGIDGLTEVGRDTSNGRIRIQLLVDRLESWQSQDIKLTYLDKDGREQVLETGPVSLEVTSNLGEKPEEAQIEPIRDILPIRSMWLDYLPWAAGTAALLIAVSGLIWWYKKRSVRTAAGIVAEPAHLLAGKEIRRLDSQGLFEKGEIKTFYFVFSEILRRYMEAVRHFPAAEYTTEEIARQVGNHPQDRLALVLLKQADLVKFADAAPTLARKDEDISAALAYIDETGEEKGEE